MFSFNLGYVNLSNEVSVTLLLGDGNIEDCTVLIKIWIWWFRSLEEGFGWMEEDNKRVLCLEWRNIIWVIEGYVKVESVTFKFSCLPSQVDEIHFKVFGGYVPIISWSNIN